MKIKADLTRTLCLIINLLSFFGGSTPLLCSPPPPSCKANFFILIVSKNLPNKQKKKIASRVSNFGASAKSNFVTFFVDFRWGGWAETLKLLFEDI